MLQLFYNISSQILYSNYFTGFPVTEAQLKEAATQSGILTFPDDFLEPEFRAECERILPDCKTIKPHECRDAYMYLKSNFQQSADTSSAWVWQSKILLFLLHIGDTPSRQYIYVAFQNFKGTVCMAKYFSIY